MERSKAKCRFCCLAVNWGADRRVRKLFVRPILIWQGNSLPLKSWCRSKQPGAALDNLGTGLRSSTSTGSWPHFPLSCCMPSPHPEMPPVCSPYDPPELLASLTQLARIYPNLSLQKKDQVSMGQHTSMHWPG